MSPEEKFHVDFEHIHDVIFPQDVRANDRVKARIRLRESGSEYEDVRVWRLSPLGVELLETERLSLDAGDAVSLELTIGGERVALDGLVVASVLESSGTNVVGIRFTEPQDASPVDRERRDGVRWICSNDFLPVAVAPNPAAFNDFMRFRIRDISRNGLLLQSSLRNKFLVPGMTLRLYATFPLIGSMDLDVKIVRVGISQNSGKDVLSIGTTMQVPTANARKILGQYLIQFSDADSSEVLKAVGLVPVSVSAGVSFSYLKSESDYRLCLDLRRLAYSAGGKVELDSDSSAMGDLLDASSRIVTGKRNGEVVASARIRFPGPNVPMEQDEFVDWPAELPRRDQMIEVSRVCTHPDYRGGDLLASLFQFCCSTSMTSRRPYVVIMSTDNLIRFYERLGWRRTGVRCVLPIYGVEHEVLVAHSFEALLGKGSNPIYWNIVWKDVAGYLVDADVISPSSLERVMFTIYKGFGPIASLMVWFGGVMRKFRTARRESS